MKTNVFLIMRNNHAFTLAEVLITLGIIGVVASLTLPGLIQNYQKIVTVNKLKQTYSLLVQAFESVKAKNDENVFIDYHYYGGATSTKGVDLLFNELKLTSSTPKQEYIDDINSVTAGWGKPQYTQYKYLPNGVLLGFQHSYGYLLIRVDVNATSKPNKAGKDIFCFIYVPRVPMQYPDMEFPSCGAIYLPDNGKPGLYPGGFNRIKDWNCKNNTDFSCTTKIMHDNWQIKNDYPW